MLKNILPPIINEQTTVLIVGSMPGQQSLDKQQYYGNPRNHFWPIMGHLLQVDIPNDYDKRIQLLQQHQIGLWDVIQSCERRGSLDATIKNEQPNDFQALFQQFPNIQAIIFNGGKAHDVFKKKIGFDCLAEKVYFKMPSTSPIPGKNIKTLDGKIDDWRILLNYSK